MTYVMSDIHGEYDAYKALLAEIEFSDSDELYVLGDCVDRGEKPIELLQDMMMRPNVFPIIGNHEYMALSVLKLLMKEITEELCAELLKIQEMFTMWLTDGGASTLKGFSALDSDGKDAILEYLGEFSLYEEVSVNGKDFVLVHAGLDNFSAERPLSDYGLQELIFGRTDYNKVYFKDKYLVTGHTPTLLTEGNTGQVVFMNNHIAIDCGKVFGGHLAAVCLNTLETFYV